MKKSKTIKGFEVSAPDVRGLQIGDYNSQINLFHVLASAEPSLASRMRNREFQALIEERTRLFVGRDFVFNAIDAILTDHGFRSGYIIVRGEPGIGKTTVAAEFVRRRACIHHFNIASQNIRTTRDFLANVCAQLIVRYSLPYKSLSDQSFEDSGLLSRLLVECTAKERSPIVIVVDAFDEAETIAADPTVNRLSLPIALPDHAYFVLTCRDQYDDHLQADRLKTIYLHENDPDNHRDVTAYIRRFLKAHPVEMVSQLTKWGVNEEEFVSVLTSKSEGNFMYLVYALADIRDGVLSKTVVENVRDLPRGLTSYYQRHWRSMKSQDSEEFSAHFEPVLCQLAAVKEPVSIQQLHEWTKLPERRIKKVLQTWQAFLNIDSTGDTELTYRLYHSSFRDFLSEEVGLKGYHERIVDAALGRLSPSWQKQIDSSSA